MQTHRPAGPEFGAPCPIRACEDTLNLLAARRSTSAQTLGGPGPDGDQVQELLRLGARVPDHGKLQPWRFVIIQGEAKARLVARLRELAMSQSNPAKAEAALAKLSTPPISLMVVSRPKLGAIPIWEQQLSAGAVCMSLLVAAQAMGFGANWITDWYAYEPRGKALLGLSPDEQVAGVIHLGAPAAPPLERERPRLGDLVSRLEI